MTSTNSIPTVFIVIAVVLILFDFVLKLFALWKAARKKQLGWFICLAFLNTCGILPAIYLFLDKIERVKSDEM